MTGMTYTFYEKREKYRKKKKKKKSVLHPRSGDVAGLYITEKKS